MLPVLYDGEQNFSIFCFLLAEFKQFAEFVKRFAHCLLPQHANLGCTDVSLYFDQPGDLNVPGGGAFKEPTFT